MRPRARINSHAAVVAALLLVIVASGMAQTPPDARLDQLIKKIDPMDRLAGYERDVLPSAAIHQCLMMIDGLAKMGLERKGDQKALAKQAVEYLDVAEEIKDNFGSGVPPRLDRGLNETKAILSPVAARLSASAEKHEVSDSELAAVFKSLSQSSDIFRD